MQLKQQQEYFQLVLDPSWFRFTTSEQHHLTLLFLGSVSEPHLDIIKQSMHFACRKLAPFVLSTSGLGAFPSQQRPSILWTGIKDESSSLKHLHNQLSGQLEGLHRQERRSYKPHLTLARVKRFGKNESIYNALVSAPEYPELNWPVSTVNLYSSQLTSTGAKYQMLYEQSLQTAKSSQNDWLK